MTIYCYQYRFDMDEWYIYIQQYEKNTRSSEDDLFCFFFFLLSLFYFEDLMFLFILFIFFLNVENLKTLSWRFNVFMFKNQNIQHWQKNKISVCVCVCVCVLMFVWNLFVWMPGKILFSIFTSVWFVDLWFQIFFFFFSTLLQADNFLILVWANYFKKICKIKSMFKQVN